MKIHVLVEGDSEKIFFGLWGSRYLKGHEVKVYPHQGRGQLPRQGQKPDPKRRGLLDQLPAKLKAFSQSMDPGQEGVLVIVDTDNDTPAQLLDQLKAVVGALEKKTNVQFGLATEELEAFYLGDLKALKSAYPRHDRAKLKDYVPDSVCGTWELFGQVIGDGGGNKVAWAQAMGPLLTTNSANSRSPSFRTLCSQMKDMVAAVPVAAPPSAKPRRAKVATSKDAHGRRKR